jgi:hypothetical protein
MYLELILLGLVSMAAPWIARFAGYQANQKPFDVCGFSGIFFLLTAAFAVGRELLPTMLQLNTWLMSISFILAVIGLAFGAIWGAVNVLREPNHELAHVTERHT